VKDGATDQGIGDVLRVMRRHWLLIALVALLFGAAALTLSQSQKDVFRADAALAFQNPSLSTDALGVGIPSTDTPEQRAADGEQRVESPSVRAAVVRRVGPLKRVDVSTRRETDTNYVVVEARAPTRARALLVVQSFVDVTQEIARRGFRAHMNRQIAALGRIGRRSKNPLAPLTLADQRARLVALRDLGTPVRVARVAAAPAARVSPRPLRNTVLALIVGLVLGTIAAFARSSADRVLRTSDDIAESTGLPVLSRIHHSTAKRFSLRTAFDGSAASELALEAGRILRTNLEFLDVDLPPTVVLVTSATTAEGKSTVATALATASALAGRRTLLLECDLRRPVLAERGDLPEAPGLADLVVGHAAVADVTHEIDVRAPADTNGALLGDGALFCVAAGTPAPRPAELLASKRFADCLAELSAAYDLTVIDAAPLLPVGDTLGLVPRADRVVLCVRARRTTRDQVRAAREALARLPTRPAAVVVTGVRRGEEGDYGYYAPYQPAGRAVAASSS
jgi:capsular exopolysaccharide synthesis family protein